MPGRPPVRTLGTRPGAAARRSRAGSVHRVSRVRRAVALVPLLAAGAALAGCDRTAALPPLPVPTPTASPRGCADFAEALPDSLGDDLARRDTRPKDDPRLAAYGEPAVVIRCGAPFSPRYERGTALISVNQVDWFQEVGGDAVTWSTPTTFVNIEVRIPTAYDAHGAILARLSAAARAAQ